MSNTTSNVGFYTFLENDVVDWAYINKNFEKLDVMALCIESGTKAAAYSGGASGNATWYYKKYSDGTIELYTKLEFDNIKCTGGAAAPYYSDSIKVLFPFTISYVDDVQMHLTSDTIGWIADITGKGVVDCAIFRIMSMTSESSNISKRVYINMKGRWK